MLYNILEDQSRHNLILSEDLSLILGKITTSSPLLTLRTMTKALTVAIAVILLTSNFTIINAQQQVEQLTTESRGVENGATTTTTIPTAAATTFQSINDSFRVHVPDGWVIQDVNNSGSALLEEGTKGYGILAQLCPEKEQQQQALPNAGTNTSIGNSSISKSNNSCRGAQKEVIHIVRYPDLDTRLLSNNVTSDNMTVDNVLAYYLHKLQEVGYRDIQIVNSTETTLNLTNPQTNQTIAKLPVKLVEMTYRTNFAPTEIRRGYLISTATTATLPNVGTTKGYTIFYEGGPVAAEITPASGSLSPLPPKPVGQAFDSFELIAAPEVAQTIAQDAQTAETTDEGGGEGGESNDDDDDDNSGSNDDDDDDNSGSNDDDDDDDNSGSNDDDNGGGGGGGNDDDNDDDNGGGARGISERVREHVSGISERVREHVSGN